MRQLLFLVLIFSTFSFAQTEYKEEMRAGEKAFKKKNWSKAEQKFKSALDIDNQSSTANYNLGNALSEAKKFDKAAKHFQDAVNLADDDATKFKAYHNLGNSYLGEKNWEKAEESFKKALKLNPSDNETRYNYAFSRKKLKQQQKNQQKKQQQDQQKSQEKQQKGKDQEEEQNQGQPKGDQQNPQKGNDAGKEQKPQQPQKNGSENKDMEKFSKGILKAIERQEKETYKRITQKKSRQSRNKNKKDW